MPDLSRRGFLAIVALALLSACEERTPATLPSAPSRTTAAANQPLRIVALSPAIAQTLRDLGLERDIVGRHAFDLSLDPALPVCGDQTGVDYEALLSVRPTHIYLEWGPRELPPRLVELAAANDWTVKSYNLLTLDEVESTAADLYATLRVARGPARPWGSTDIALSMQEAWSRQDFGPHPVGRVLLLAGVEPPGALGPGSFHAQILDRLGGTPAITTGAAWQVLDAEDVLTLKPDGIIIFRPRKRDTPPAQLAAPELRAAIGHLGTLDIPANRTGRIALIDDPLGLTPSTAMIGVARRMAEILHTWSAQPAGTTP